MGTWGFALRAGHRFAFGLCSAVACALATPAAWATDLETEIRDLVQSHPQVQAAAEGVSSADAAVSAARSNYLPQVHITANTGPEAFNNTTIQQPIDRNGYGGGVTLTQHLWDAHATDSAVDSALDTKSVSESTLRGTRQTTILEAVNAYLDVQRQRQLVKLARDDEQRLQTQLHLEDERVERGAGVTVDVLAAKHRLQLAKERRVGYEGTFEQAIDRYTQVFGHAPDELTDKMPEPPASVIPTTLEEALKIAEAENPTVEAAKRTVNVTAERITAARAGYFPTVDLVGGADVGDNRDGNVNMSHDWKVILQLNWDLFTGFRTQAQVSQAAHDLSASKDTALQAQRKADEAVKLAWSQVQTARERLEVLENAVNLAFDVWDSRKKMREAGKATVIDVLDAESDITNAQVTYLNALLDRKVATYSLLQSIGRLEPGNLEEVAGAAPAPAAK